jgi:hypothetical protein
MQTSIHLFLAKSTKTFEKKLRKKVKNTLEKIERINEEENKAIGDLDVKLEADCNNERGFRGNYCSTLFLFAV